MDVRGTKIFWAAIILSILASSGTVRSQDCRKGAGGGNPPWFNAGGKCNNRQRTFIFAGTVGWPERNETHCYLYIHICSLVVKRNTIQPLGTTCPAAKDFAQPTICCDEFNKAVQSKQPCDAMQDADCDGISNDKDGDPLKPDQKYGEKGFVYVSTASGNVNENPSADSPVVSTVPHGSRISFTDVKEMSGSLWYYATPLGQPSGWIPADEVSCGRPPPLPPGRKIPDNEFLILLNAHPVSALGGARG